VDGIQYVGLNNGLGFFIRAERLITPLLRRNFLPKNIDSHDG